MMQWEHLSDMDKWCEDPERAAREAAERAHIRYEDLGGQEAYALAVNGQYYQNLADYFREDGQESKADYFQRLADERTLPAKMYEFWQGWHEIVAYLSDDVRLAFVKDGVNSELMLIEEGRLILKRWYGIPTAIIFRTGNGNGAVGIWPDLPKVTAYTVDAGLLAKLNEYVPIPGQTWLADSITTASPKVVNVEVG